MLPLVTLGPQSDNHKAVARMSWPPGYRSRPIKNSIREELIENATRGKNIPVILYHVSYHLSPMKTEILRQILVSKGYSFVNEAPQPPQIPWEPRVYEN